jgi:hypothetical protein
MLLLPFSVIPTPLCHSCGSRNPSLIIIAAVAAVKIFLNFFPNLLRFHLFFAM